MEKKSLMETTKVWFPRAFCSRLAAAEWHPCCEAGCSVRGFVFILCSVALHFYQLVTRGCSAFVVRGCSKEDAAKFLDSICTEFIMMKERFEHPMLFLNSVCFAVCTAGCDVSVNFRCVKLAKHRQPWDKKLVIRVPCSPFIGSAPVEDPSVFNNSLADLAF